MRSEKAAVFRTMCPFLALLMFSSQVWGQSKVSIDQKTIAQLVRQIKELQQHDKELEERIRTLEQRQEGKAGQTSETTPAVASSVVPPAELDTKPTAMAEAPPATSEAAPPSQEEQSSAAVPLPEMHTLHGIQWRGFAEVDYRVLDQRTPELGTYGFVPGSAGNFYTGDFDLFLNSRLNDKASVLAELDVEEGDAQTFKIDLRRMLLKYDVNEHLRFSFGRYQTSIGYYNWAFRSAGWLQTTADRPLVMEFASDGGILPTQAVGISVTGRIPSGKLGLNYVAEYGSSDTIRPDINGDGFQNDENNGNQVNVGFFLNPDTVPGLRVGGSIYHDQISDLTELTSTGAVVTSIPNDVVPSPSARWNQTIVNGHVAYVGRGFEFLNEGFLIRHAPIGSGETFDTPAFYSQFSKKLGPIRPFVRYQYINASPNNTIYDDVRLRYGPSFGARYDINENFAFKAQLDHTLRHGFPDLNGLHLQLTGTF